MKKIIYCLALVAFIFTSCKKENTVENGFVLYIGATKYVLPKLEFIYSPDPSIPNHFSYLIASSEDDKTKFYFKVINNSNISVPFTYSIYTPGATLVLDQFYGFTDATTSKRKDYYRPSADFKLIITFFDSQNKKIRGSFSGSATNGICNGISCTDMGSNSITGSFDMNYQ